MIIDETFDDLVTLLVLSSRKQMIGLRRYQLRSNPEKFEEVDNNVGTRWEREPESPEYEGGPPSPYFHICIHVTRDSLSYMYNVFG
jgi:hypothetical protein